jgi:hypothetical protein
MVAYNFHNFKQHWGKWSSKITVHESFDIKRLFLFCFLFILEVNGRCYSSLLTLSIGNWLYSVFLAFSFLFGFRSCIDILLFFVYVHNIFWFETYLVHCTWSISFWIFCWSVLVIENLELNSVLCPSLSAITNGS